MLFYEELSDKVISSAIEVHRNLGSGYLEKVYENALLIELKHRDFEIEQQKSTKIYYKGTLVGSYTADLIINNTIIVELKAVYSIEPVFSFQVLNYLRAFNLPVGLILNFGTNRVQIKRILNPSILNKV